MNEQREKSTLPPQVVKSATTLREQFETAKVDLNYINGWYARMNKWDIEVLIEHVLGPLPEPEPEPVTTKAPASFVETVSPAFVPGYDIETDTYTTGAGQRITNVHAPSLCVGRGCVIHHPSDHSMIEWPTNWRDGGMFDIKPPHMERICPHGIGHPDPDDLAFQGEGAIGIHGCDGCCGPTTTEAR